MKTLTLLSVALLIFTACKKDSVSVTQGNHNSTSLVATRSDEAAKITSVIIGTQIWMSGNLNVTKYRNGEKIPQVTDPVKWAKLTTGAWCYYNNDTANGAIYGKLYNWYAVTDPRGLAPAGWHVPTEEEWATLSNNLGGDLVAGGAMKETGTAHWLTPNISATNSSGFTGLPGGWRNYGTGGFLNINVYGKWWSATEHGVTTAYRRDLYQRSARLQSSPSSSKQIGASVRCIKN